jgi:inorganic pyrophosphatase
MDFWTRLDELIASHEIVIDRPRGSRHPRIAEWVYPLDYGYLQGTSSGDGDGIDVWVGSQEPARLVAVVCTVDSEKRDAEIKLLIGCSEAEMEAVARFHNQGDAMSGMLVKRNG